MRTGGGESFFGAPTDLYQSIPIGIRSWQVAARNIAPLGGGSLTLTSYVVCADTTP
ncbi:hypothetical protein [Streptomyces sp. NBC_01264]|uniref:hypothetical protein n=1 Tax=Streptomyces sp. NBC_01264 TaxID=2903804 RepID=UPI00224CC614|nr:hypothetical protein [Streptomyces sp. NBC_01264]MCX4781630.1 hypothetical protein [Streptomyces sp. NBC_01264]